MKASSFILNVCYEGTFRGESLFLEIINMEFLKGKFDITNQFRYTPGA